MGYAAQARPKQHIFWLKMAISANKCANAELKIVDFGLKNRIVAIINVHHGLIFCVYDGINYDF